MPNEVVEKLPSKLPSILLDTDLSKQLRIAYIEHLVSNIITHQIFEPFLFTLAARRKSMDNLVMEWSESLRERSKKRETLFRQYLLHAAYTSSSAKQSINKVAVIIVDKVVDAIKPLTKQANWEHVRVGIRRIVKLAVETWRHARLEKAVITASLSQGDSSTAPGSGLSGEGIPSMEPSPNLSRKILLSLFPMIERMSVPEEVRGGTKEEIDRCVYTPGRVLYADDPVVLAGLQELGQAKENVSDTAKLDSTDLRDQAKIAITRTETEAVEEDSLPKIGQRAISLVVTNQPSLSTVQPPLMTNDEYLNTSGKINGEGQSALLPPPAGDLAAIRSHSRSCTPPPSLSRRSTSTTDNESRSDGDSVSTRIPAGLPDWGDATGAVPGINIVQGGW